MNWKDGLRRTGVPAALFAALLFGAGTPLAKMLVNNISPWLLAGLLYLGSGFGLTVFRRIRQMPKVRLSRAELPWFAGAVLSGGVVAPVLLMFGLTGMPASGASLLLNAEGVFTALLAWFAFKENFDSRIALGMLAIVIGALILSWPTNIEFSGLWSALAILAACFAWGVDNNLTRKVSLTDATWIASVKGLVAGMVNLTLAFSLGASLPSLGLIFSAMLLGLLAYGISLVLFVVALRHLGTARTGAYFSIAPFFGALLAIFMGEPLTLSLALAGTLMILGIWLHVTENHNHIHNHELQEHEHEHIHDEHHQHTHDEWATTREKHTHWHRHEPLTHMHGHYPDAHHQHHQ